MWVGGQHQNPAAALAPGKTRYALCKRLGGPQGSVCTCMEDLAPPPGLDPRTVQACSKSLYRLSYLTTTVKQLLFYIMIQGYQKESVHLMNCTAIFRCIETFWSFCITHWKTSVRPPPPPFCSENKTCSFYEPFEHLNTTHYSLLLPETALNSKSLVCPFAATKPQSFQLNGLEWLSWIG